MAIAHETSPEPPTYPIGSVDSALRLLLMVGERQNIRILEARSSASLVRPPTA
jgi:hypothetical protein